MKGFILCLCILLTCSLTECDNVTQSGAVTSQIQFLINEEKDLRRNLETRLQRLRNDAAAVNTTIVPCNCPATKLHYNSSRQVSFTATMRSYMSGLTTLTKFPFTNDVSNIGNAYNSSNAEFTAPVNGIYGLSLTVFMNPRYWVGMQLVRNGHSILKVRTGHYAYSSTNRQVNMGTNFLLLNMTAGDTVWPQYLGDSDSARIYGDGVTTISGFLLHEWYKAANKL